ncbi:MAG: META domain-containing protein, partial [Acidimicrobiia bacterium]|nr:META domain-containing protein [Acidimicrobiia bacterium]
GRSSPPATDGEDPPIGNGFDPTLSGREFWSSAVTEGGEVRPLVDGTRIRLTFTEEHLGASAGCNSMGGSYTIDGESPDSGTLRMQEISMTEMGCDGPRHAQDDWLIAFLQSSPTLQLAGDELTLSNSGITITLLDREIADPDRRLDGTEWIITGFIDDDAAMNIPVPRPGSLVFDTANSTLTGDDGCNRFGGPVEISDGSTGGPVAGDGELQFGPIEATQELCEEYIEYSERLYRVLESGQASYVIEGPNLTIIDRSGAGITLRAADA